MRQNAARIALVLYATLLPFSAAHANVTCPAGQRLSTAADVSLGLPANTCIDDAIVQRLKGGCDYNPYQMLETQFKGNRNAQISPVASNGPTADLRQGIDPALACRLTKLFQAAQQQGCRVQISSAYRSAAQQAGMCGAGRSGCAPAGRSCHQYGLAVDVTSGCVGWLRRVAPQFQLVFPYYGDHIQCAEHPVAACSPQTQPCNGGLRINPDLSQLPSPSQVPNTYFQPPTVPAAMSPASSGFPSLTPGLNQPQATPPATIPNTFPSTANTGTQSSAPLPSLTTGAQTLTPTGGTWSIPTTGPALATTSAAFNSLVSYSAPQTFTSSSSATGVSVPTQSSGSASLNTDLTDTNNAFTPGSNIAMGTTEPNRIAENSIAVDPIVVTETFTGANTRTISDARMATPTAGGPNQNDSLIRTMLLILRDFLVALLRALQTQDQGIFSAPWRIPTPVGDAHME